MSLHQSGENELPLALPQPFPQKIKGIHKLSAEAFGKETLHMCGRGVWAMGLR